MSKASEVLGVSRDAFYKRGSRPEQGDSNRHVILELVLGVRQAEPRTGTRKLHHRILPALAEQGLHVGRDALFTMLRKEDLLVARRRRFERTTYSKHAYAVAPNVFKGMAVTAPNQALVSDITYIRLRRGFAYLFLVTDAYSRKIVGYHLSRDLGHYSALLAVNRAIVQIGDTKGVVHHSDRGCQYCCHEYLNFLTGHGMVPSMTDDCHCYQNAIAERVNGILKDEFFMDATFDSFDEALQCLENAIGVYNGKRTHWSLGLRTPNEVYAEAA